MGDADSRANVGADDDTRDGDEPRSHPPSVAPPQSTPRDPGDYPELVAVDRRHYQIEGQIAKGGMGRILAARDRRLGRAVAIKELLPKNRDAAKRFETEARITARLQHPSIIHIYEAAVWNGGEPFYAMPHVEGLSLDKVVAKLKTFGERLGLLSHVIAVADALAYAHNQNVIHRDLKPHNVLVGAFGETVVIDWGLAKDLETEPDTPIDPMVSMVKRLNSSAKETSDGKIVGTPAYMPPEQAHGKHVDRRADVYSLGALLYHVLVGEPPFRGTESQTVIEKVKVGPSPNVAQREPRTPKDLVAIVTKAMARDPDDRYADAAELARDLKAFQTGRLVEAHRYSRRELVVRWLRRNAVVVGISTAALIALAVVVVISFSRILEEKRQAERGRNSLLEERGRSELLDGQAGRAIAYLYEAAKDGHRGGARGLLIADAMRPFEAQLDSFPAVAAAFASNGDVVALDTTGIQVHAPDHTTRAFDDHNPVARNRVLIAGDRVITVDDDRKIRVWSPAGRLVRKLHGHTGTIRDAHVSGRLLVTGGDDGTARVWDLDTGAQVAASIECNAGLPVVGVRLSPAGDYAVLATEDHTLCLWDTRTGGTATGEALPLRSHKARIRTIRWNPDPARKLLLTASDDGTALVWDPFKGKPVMAALVHDGRAIASAEWSSDGRMVVTAGADHVARLWKIPDDIREDDPTLKAKELRRFVGHAAALDAVVFDANDARIATAGYDNKAKVWDVASGELVATFEHADVVSTIAFSPAGDRLLTASNDQTTRLWDLAEHGVVRAPHELDAQIFAVAAAADGTVAAATADSHVTIWRGKAPPVTLREHDGRVFALAFSRDGKQLASAGEDEAAILWEGDKEAKRLGPYHGAIRAIAYAPDAAELATAGDEGKVRLWARGAVVTLDHDTPLVELAYSPDGTQLVALDGEGRVIAWSRLAGLSVVYGLPVIHAALTTGKTRAFAFSTDGKLFVAGGTDTKIYAVRSGRIDPASLVTVDGPTGEVHTVAFTRDGACVITAGVDGVVQLWDAAKGKLLGTRGARGGAVDSLAVTADGATVWAGGADQLVRGWDIHSEQHGVDDLAAVVARSPWTLDENDVVRLKTGGNGNEQR